MGELAYIDTIHPLSNKFVTGVKTKATGESKLNDSPVYHSKWFTLNILYQSKYVNVLVLNSLVNLLFVY